jgi:hypothetical protein
LIIKTGGRSLAVARRRYAAPQRFADWGGGSQNKGGRNGRFFQWVCGGRLQAPELYF